MPKALVYNMAGEQVGEVQLYEAIFCIEPNEHILHDAVMRYLANQRQGTQSALTRGEVSGGGRSPGVRRAQAVPGQAPSGHPTGLTAVSPLPQARDYSYSLNKKEKRLALKSALSSRRQEETLLSLTS